MLTHRFGKHSLENLKFVHPDLVAIVRLALAYCTEDFKVIEGLV